INPETLMNPNLQFAQAIHGRTTGRGTGIIDTLQLVDVVRGASAIEFSGALSNTEQQDKSKWPYPHDVMYFDQWPLREQSLLFAGLALNKLEYLDLWRTLNEDPTVEEAIRNYPIRQPVLWMNPAIDRDVSV